MANRIKHKANTLTQEVVSVFAKVSFGGLGAPTLDTSASVGVKSVTKVSATTGQYDIVLGSSGSVDVYNDLLGVSATLIKSAVADAPVVQVISEAVDSTGTVRVGFSNGTALTDPASGDVALIRIDLKNSKVL